MARTLEVIFHWPLQLLLLMILPPVLGVAIVYFVFPHTYLSATSLWALQRYQIIGATGPETDLLATPAETQSSALSELLQTRSFALSVAKATQVETTLDLSPGVQADPSLRDDALFTEISHNVQVVPQAYNLFVISYANRNPLVAQQVVEAVIQNFTLQSRGLTTLEGQNLLDSYRIQLIIAKQNANQAATIEAQYLRGHPDLLKEGPEVAAATDPQYAQVHAQTQQAQAVVLSLQTAITTLETEVSIQGDNATNLFKILDPPYMPDRPVSRTKLFLIAGGVGLGIAILAYVLFLIILVRRDHSVYSAPDLQNITAAPVLMQFPLVPSTAIPLLVQRSLVQNEIRSR